ncbi:MAG TPA: BatA domain-containing protein, partial [Longimicrobium sp.]
MLTLGAPLFLVAGGLAALVPLALHLIRRRPPTRSPLPTARFLSEDARSSIRVSRPTDRLLMALRMLLLLLAGAAFARPSWIPAPRGTREVVLLDRSAAMRDSDAWRRAVEQARRTLLAPDGTARGDLILFDTSAVHLPQRRLTAATFDSLAAAGPSAHPTSYAVALRAIDPAARALRGADSVRVTMLSALRWGGWRPGMAALRQAAWPGAIRLSDLSSPTSPAAAAPTGPELRRSAVVIASGGAGRFVIPALEATGWTTRVAERPSALPSDARLIIAIHPAGDLRALAEAGATLVVD